LCCRGGGREQLHGGGHRGRQPERGAGGVERGAVVRVARRKVGVRAVVVLQQQSAEPQEPLAHPLLQPRQALRARRAQRHPRRVHASKHGQ